MKKRHTFLVRCFTLLLIFLFSIVTAVAAGSDQETVTEGNSAFAFDLYAKLKHNEGNLFFSPFSISTALAMTSAGARGKTEQQMRSVLHVSLRQEHLHPTLGTLITELNAGGGKGAYELSIANALWGQKGFGFANEFLALTKRSYGAGFYEVDFRSETESARNTINGWVEKQTNKKITNLIPPGVLDVMTRLVLTNAIYFKGKWDKEFSLKETNIAKFILLDNKSSDVPMMHQHDQFNYADAKDIQILEMPYKGNELSMVILLPRKTNGVGSLEKSLSLKTLNDWLVKLQQHSVHVYLPKFKVTKEFMLSKVLRSMGIKDAFSLPQADFSGMNGKRDLFISAIVHKAYIDVNEEGTEAAAATGIGISTTSVPPPPIIFRADHPFVFLIRDVRSGSILFLGRVVNPAG